MYDEKTISSFERVMRKNGCKILPKVFTPFGDILFAERSFISGTEKVYETFWMVSRDGIDFGRGVRNKWSVPANVRHAEALADATNWIDINIRNKRYA